MNPLGSVVSSNHHQNSINCFNSASSSVAASMSTTMLPGSMGTSLTGSGTTPTAPCPYTTPTNPYSMYHHRTTAEPGNAMSSSIATLRLKAKQHSSGFSSPYSTQSSISPVSRSNSGGLSACQYAGVTDTVWDNVLVGTLLSQTSSLNNLHLLNNDHEMSFDHRDNHPNHQDSNGTNAVITDDEECTGVSQNGQNQTLNDEIAD